ncbi:amine oxidase [Rhodococcus sp. EPR-157]|uniref:flavin monoamine oxidase family protein n=1 Tax=Rhodococcus sp. EPR-157 TaxID=1813677 RepID=UPI0007BB5D76|nr:NAD(P)/FAD-dependent oxidoreductase [Rhodococcus sp. EPR-157]KZF13359.1 amine oxidase [Rhodococcus sp. EPR-157]
MSPHTPPEQHTTVAIVGAGMAGLIAGRNLRRQGIDVLILESANRVGGRVLSETSVLGSRLDLGGQWIGYGHNRFENLAEDLGVNQFPMHTPTRPVIVRNGRAVSPYQLGSLVALIALGGFEMRSKLKPPKSWSTTTIDGWIRQLPSSTARRLLQVSIEVATTADLDQFVMSAFAAMVRDQGGLSAMTKTRGGAQETLIVEGVGTLTDQIAAELGKYVLLNTTVQSIHRTDVGISLKSSTGTVHADRIIVCVPPPRLKGISFDPPLPRDLIQLSNDSYMGSVYKAIAVYNEPFWRESLDAEFMLLDRPAGAVFDTSPPDGPGHLCMLIGGKEARTLDAMNPSARRDAVLNSLATAAKLPGLRRPAGWHEKAWHLDEYVGGGYSALPRKDVTHSIYPAPSEPIAGTMFWAGTETATEHAGYIEGAIQSGERAARQVLDSLR